MVMKARNLREQTDEELAQLAVDMRKELFDLKVKKGSGVSASQPLRIRTLRRDLARIETVLTERVVRARAVEPSAEQAAVTGT
jgi:large subunit ribosomal protein L29